MKNLKINLEPRIVLPKDENGDTYIGVYIDDELVSKIAIGKDSASSVTVGDDSINTTVQSIDGKTSIDIESGGITLKGATHTLGKNGGKFYYTTE